MSEFSSLFGKALLNNDFKPVPISCLAGKYVAVYFSYCFLLIILYFIELIGVDLVDNSLLF